MLVGQSTAEYVLIKAFVYTFSYLGLACLLYFYLALSIGGVKTISHPVSIAIEVIGAIEILFYLFWFLPYRHYLQKQPPRFPPSLNRSERHELFYKSLSVTSDIELFTRKWMCGASIEDLRRESLKEWLLWAFFNREGPPGDDDEELEGYLESIEEVLGRNIKPGYGPAKTLRLNFDKIKVSHRSLLYYLVIGITDFAASILLLVLGFTFYRQPRSKFLKSFPMRPMTLLAPKQSASPNFSYFYRPHKSEKHRPIILVHGVGIGLPVYIPLMMKIPKDIGVLAIEILPISSRITTSIPLFIDLMREVGDIVSQQNLQDFVFIGHSYGTFFTKVFLESTYLSSRMHSIVLMDPVAVLLHLPDLAYNFFVKEPKEANELQLWWAAQTEPDIAFTLTRRFCWHDHVVWREDLMDKPTTIVIGEKDCIVNSDAIASYITKGVPEADAASIVTKPDLTWNWEDREKWKRSIEEWKGEGLELFWMEGYDHGQAFLSPKMLSKLVNIFEKICKVEGSNEKMTEEEEENVQQFEFEPESKPEPDINGSGIRDV